MSFFSSLKKKMSTHQISTELDTRLLQKTQRIVKYHKAYSVQVGQNKSWKWALSSFAVACLVIVLFSQVEKQAAIQQEVAKMESVLDPSSVEFIKHHEEIELMTESADWSEEEWAIALGKKPSENS
jgi:hypothetical protein